MTNNGVMTLPSRDDATEIFGFPARLTTTDTQLHAHPRSRITVIRESLFSILRLGSGVVLNANDGDGVSPSFLL